MNRILYYITIVTFLVLTSCKDKEPLSNTIEAIPSETKNELTVTSKWQNIRSSDITDIAINSNEIYALRKIKDKIYISNFVNGKWKNTLSPNTKQIELSNGVLYKLFTQKGKHYIGKLNQSKWEEIEIPQCKKFTVGNNIVYGVKPNGDVFEVKNNSTTTINHKLVKDIAFSGSNLYLLKKNAKNRYIISKTKDKSFRNINANSINNIFYENGHLYANKKTKNGTILLKREANKWTNTKIQNIKNLEIDNGSIFALRRNKKAGRNILSYKEFLF